LIPKDEATGYANWDCPAALDLERFKQTLDHIRNTGQLPDEFKSIQDTHNDSDFGISEAALADLTLNAASSISPDWDIVFVDGFLMFTMDDLLDRFDIKLLIRMPFSELKQRRQSKGYATVQGNTSDREVKA
jgi:nicotinamide/nicotinate riboside kinase